MDRTRDRVASVTIAVLLQLGFVTIFMMSLPLIVPAKRLPREIIFLLPRLRETPRSNTAPRRPMTLPSLPQLNLPSATAPPIFVPPATIPPPSRDLEIFGKDLFGCAPENLSKLTPQQRSHCGGFAAVPRDRDAVTDPPSLVKDRARREAELAARNTPARVPCVTLTSRTIGFAGGGGQDTGGMIDPLCVLNGLINGFHAGLPP